MGFIVLLGNVILLLSVISAGALVARAIFSFKLSDSGTQTLWGVFLVGLVAGLFIIYFLPRLVFGAGCGA